MASLDVTPMASLDAAPSNALPDCDSPPPTKMMKSSLDAVESFESLESPASPEVELLQVGPDSF